ncbi:MAG: EamA family transporter [Acidimicrobiia bacterium]|jgi:drug/metabolite transporter, DME family
MERRGLLAALAAAFLFGVSGVVAAGAFSAVGPAQVAQSRSVMAAVLLGLVAWRRGALSPGGRLGSLAGLGALLAVVTITYYVAIDRLGVGPGVTIQFLGPVLVLVWMTTVQKRPVPGIAWAAAVTAVIGTLFITEAWNVDALDPIGAAAGLGAAVTFAGYLVVGEYLGKRLPEITVAAYGFGFAAVIWLVFLPVRFPTAGSGVWPSLIWVGVAGTAIPFLLEIVALRRADPGRVGVVATAEPVVAGLTAWVVLGQALGGLQLLGMAMTVAGVASIQAITHSVAPDIPPEVV